MNLILRELPNPTKAKNGSNEINIFLKGKIPNFIYTSSSRQYLQALNTFLVN